jgi:hypothetical protein
MKVTVTHVSIPPMSSLGYGTAMDGDGNPVHFVGDHRPMREIGEAIQRATNAGELPTTELEDWQLQGSSPSG